MVMRSILTALFIVFTATSHVVADPLYDDMDRFIENNPDGKKYEFVRTYLNALMYFKKNADRQKELPTIDINNLAEAPSVAPIVLALKKDNVNLRIARNLVKKFKTPENGLILKVADLFAKVCDDQMEYNDYDRVLYERIAEIQESGYFEDFYPESFLEAQELLAEQRRASFKELMEASMLINIVLVSPDRNYYGDFYRLGLTRQQRQNLLYKIDDFKGKGFSGGVEEGQTFLQGSVNVIRQILENDSWQVMDD